MITSIQYLRNIGQFEYVSASAISLDRYVLVYAENGRGKTTLTAILRSLATGDPLPIRERRRLAAAHSPNVALRCSDGPAPAVFSDGAWNRTLPNITVFDDRFVDENVCSGLTVAPSHRQNLHEVVIGAQGVALNRRLQGLVQQIEDHNATLRTRAAAIGETLRGPFTVDEFCDLPAVEQIETEIQSAERHLAAAQQQDSVRQTPEFEMLQLPIFDTAALTATLRLDLPTLETQAVTRVQAHFARIGPGGEAWVADGLPRTTQVEGGRLRCPFCTQDLANSQIMAHYRAYFSDAYAQLKRRIAEARAAVERSHPRDIPARFERSVRANVQRRQFWSNFCEVPEVAYDTEQITEHWQAARDATMETLAAKQAAPLDRIDLPEATSTALDQFAAAVNSVRAINDRLDAANNVIRSVKSTAAAEDAEAASRNLRALRAIQNRYTAEVSALCQDYIESRNAKAVTEGERDAVRGELETYREIEFPRYQNAINEYLNRFGAGYRISRVTPANTRGGPTCNYDISINDVPIPISSAEPSPGEPTFKSTLSSGDRNTLALAFFFASLDRTPDLSDHIVVIDDPVCSLDEQRALATAQELRRVAERASQTIVLSHDRNFLSRIWRRRDTTHCTAIKLERESNGTNITTWDIDADSFSEHDRNHALLRTYLRSGPAQNRRDVATALRPVLEGFLRVAYPEHFPPRQNAMRLFRNLCRDNLGTDAEILSRDDLQELDDLVEYANRFHHHNANPSRQQAIVNDGELRTFVERVLRFATRSHQGPDPL